MGIKRPCALTRDQFPWTEPRGLGRSGYGWELDLEGGGEAGGYMWVYVPL